MKIYAKLPCCTKMKPTDHKVTVLLIPQSRIYCIPCNREKWIGYEVKGLALPLSSLRGRRGEGGKGFK